MPPSLEKHWNEWWLSGSGRVTAMPVSALTIWLDALTLTPFEREVAARAERELGWRAEVPLEEGLRLTWESITWDGIAWEDITWDGVAWL